MNKREFLCREAAVEIRDARDALMQAAELLRRAGFPKRSARCAELASAIAAHELIPDQQERRARARTN